MASSSAADDQDPGQMLNAWLGELDSLQKVSGQDNFSPKYLVSHSAWNNKQ